MIRTLLAALLLTATPLFAERILTPEEFDAISRNQTQYFYRDGEFFGAEQFDDQRQSIWLFSDGQCDRGVWYPEEDYICFVYETEPIPQCWHVIEKDNGDIVARLRGASPEFDIIMEFIDREPIPCNGPPVGV